MSTIIFSNKNKQKNFSPNNEKKERDIFPLRRDNDSPSSSHQEPSKNSKKFFLQKWRLKYTPPPHPVAAISTLAVPDKNSVIYLDSIHQSTFWLVLTEPY